MGWKSAIFLLLLLTGLNSSKMEHSKLELAADENDMYDYDTYLLSLGQNKTLYCKGEGVTWTRQIAPLSQHHGGFTFTVRPEKRMDGEYMALDLVNVNEHTVGYYACHRADVHVDLNDLMEEPESTEDVIYVYIYVNGTKSSFTDMRSSLFVPENTQFVVPCRPTEPNTDIKLLDMSQDVILPSKNYTYSPKIGFVLDDPELSSTYKCVSRHNMTVTVTSFDPDNLHTPKVYLQERFKNDTRLVGESIKIYCSVLMTGSVSLVWICPNKKQDCGNIETIPEDLENGDQRINKTLELTNLTLKDAGIYKCAAVYDTTVNRTAEISIKVLEKPFLSIETKGFSSQHKNMGSRNLPSWRVNVDCYPEPIYTIFRGEKMVYPVDGNNKKYLVKRKDKSVNFIILDTNMQDSGTYTMHISSGNLEQVVNFTAIVEGPANASLSTSKRYRKGRKCSFECKVSGNPLPSTLWRFQPFCEDTSNCSFYDYNESYRKPNKIDPYAYSSFLELTLYSSGNLTCIASNTLGNADISGPRVQSSTADVFLYESDDGFAIEGDNWYSSRSKVELDCVASKYDYREDVKWYKLVGGERKKIGASTGIRSDTYLSYVRKLKILESQPSDSGIYECEARRRQDNVTEVRQHDVTVAEWRNPVFVNSLGDGDLVAKENLDMVLNCTAEAVPPPTINWFRDDLKITEGYTDTQENHTVVTSSLTIRDMTHQDLGQYKCVVTADDGQGEISSYVNVKFKNMGVDQAIYLSIIGIIVVGFTIVVIYLFWKFRKERRYRRKLYQQFNNGIGALSKHLALDEQADRLPYIKSFEFPLEDLKMSNDQLGRGAFGEVYRAEARGIIDAEKETTVAVKKVKPNADRMYVDALVSELKIMIHMGRHLNVLNLLGACTKKIAKRELWVILEYCKYGNIHKYMQTHRRSFIDELTDSRNRLEKGHYNRGFSNMGSDISSVGYYSHSHTPVTGHTTINTGDTGGIRTDGSEIPLLEIKGSESDSREVNWRSNYNYYDEDGSALQRPLTSTDLISWAYQIAAGMEYLASRKILHGDLAARNVLLAEDNVVKICDFGLARSIQKNEEYKKESKDPVPVKWLALECLEQQIFSTQSDVWSFGVVLWELFSLACTPYPGVDPQRLTQMLQEGMRLEKPLYANNELYNMMRACWDARPKQRPTFSTLHSQLGTLLNMQERERYERMNAPYVEANEQWRVKHDLGYLDQLPAPDYCSEVGQSPCVTPSPTPGQYDAEGYLAQVSPHSQTAAYTHSKNNGFAFPRVPPRPSLDTEPAASAERAPMLPNPEAAYIQIQHDSIPEEEDEVFTDNRETAAMAVDNPSYQTLMAPEARLPTYQNIISNNRVMNRA